MGKGRAAGYRGWAGGRRCRTKQRLLRKHDMPAGTGQGIGASGQSPCPAPRDGDHTELGMWSLSQEGHGCRPRCSHWQQGCWGHDRRWAPGAAPLVAFSWLVAREKVLSGAATVRLFRVLKMLTSESPSPALSESLGWSLGMCS